MWKISNCFPNKLSTFTYCTVIKVKLQIYVYFNIWNIKANTGISYLGFHMVRRLYPIFRFFEYARHDPAKEQSWRHDPVKEQSWRHDPLKEQSWRHDPVKEQSWRQDPVKEQSWRHYHVKEKVDVTILLRNKVDVTIL